MWWLLLAAVAAQTIDPLRLLAPDSSRVVARARDVQRQFESDRRRKLPVVPAPAGRCDERIGRFCYWYDEGDTTLPAEPQSIRTARSRLNEALAQAHAAEPASNWLLGQRVRYLLEQHQPDSALAVAARCGGTPWWCSALAGLASHVAERFSSADSGFAIALAEMPPEAYCLWTDWSVVLDAESPDCATRRRFSDSLFLLAKPLLSEPGNDLRTELLSRRTMAALHAFARSPHLIPWGKDMEELLLRYGWSIRWSVGDPPVNPLELPGITGHQRSPSYQFFPRPGPDGVWTWNLQPDRARFRYAPTYADRFSLTDEAQIARFPRGDSTIVVAGFVPAPETTIALAAIGRPDTPAVVARADSSSPLGSLLVRVAGPPMLAALETRTGRGRHITATRLGFDPAGQPGPLRLSDPLFFTVDTDLPETLEAAAARAFATNRISRDTPVGIYWEAAGPDLGADSAGLDVAVSVIPLRRGLLGRVGEGLSLVKRRAPLTLQWQASGGAFELDLRRQKPGSYLLRLEARAGGTTATSHRAFHLTP